MAELPWLRTFLAIYRTGSLTRAGKMLRLTQPAISQHLKGLEAQVGWPLFARHARGVVPTPAGEELASMVGHHLDALEAITEKMRPNTQGRPGVVHVGGPVDLLAMKVLPALAGAIEQGVRIVAHPGVVADVMAKLARGDLHLAITEHKALPGMDREIELEKLFEYEPVIVTGAARAAELRAMKDRAARAKSLAAGPFVAFNEEMPIVCAVLKEVCGVVIEGPPSVAVPDLRAVAEVVAAGRGIAVLPRPLIESMLERRALYEYVLESPPRAATLWLATRRGTGLSPRIAVVRTMLRAAASQWGRAPRTKK